MDMYKYQQLDFPRVPTSSLLLKQNTSIQGMLISFGYQSSGRCFSSTMSLYPVDPGVGQPTMSVWICELTHKGSDKVLGSYTCGFVFWNSLWWQKCVCFDPLQTSSKAISKLARPNAPLGYGLCFLNLAFDGFTNATQDSIKARYSLVTI